MLLSPSPFSLPGEAEAVRSVPAGTVLLAGVPARGLARGTPGGVRAFEARAGRGRRGGARPLYPARASGREDGRRRAREPASGRSCCAAARDERGRLRAVRQEPRAAAGVRALPGHQVLLAGVPESRLAAPQARLRAAGGAARGAELEGPRARGGRGDEVGLSARAPTALCDCVGLLGLLRLLGLSGLLDRLLCCGEERRRRARLREAGLSPRGQCCANELVYRLCATACVCAWRCVCVCHRARVCLSVLGWGGVGLCSCVWGRPKS